MNDNDIEKYISDAFYKLKFEYQIKGGLEALFDILKIVGGCILAIVGLSALTLGFFLLMENFIYIPIRYLLAIMMLLLLVVFFIHDHRK